MRTISRVGVLFAAFLAPASLAAQATPVSTPASELDAVRVATERFRDVAVARAEGYLEHPGCITATNEGLPSQIGSMGVHYFRPDLLGLTVTEPRVDGNGLHTDFRSPSILVYEPKPDRSLELVAIENLVFAEAWHAAGHTEAPSFLGNAYYYRHDNPETPVDEAHGFRPHYELHVWLYRENPSGMFMQYNPGVRCSDQHASHETVSSR